MYNSTIMLDKTYNHKKYEGEIYKLWEASNVFSPKISKDKKPYTIVLPLPNASGRMHTGNVLMIAIEDLLIRWKRMQGYSTLWVPGTDHAGFETQITYERKLKEEGKSRFDFDRQTLYQKIWDFVQENKHLIEGQIKSMGASIDWSRYKFSLDPEVVSTVIDTFQKLYDDGLVYRDDYMVNFCPKCGTTFADLEVVHKERVDPLYYMKYGPFTLATVRPETKFGDTAIAVHPNDKRYKKFTGKEIEVEGLLGNFKIKVIADNYVDQKFGTGVVKVTPAHDKNDYEVGKRHNLEIRKVIDLEGRLNKYAGKYAGLTVLEARKAVVHDLKEKGLLVKVDENYKHSVSVCYKGGHDIEPTILPNWFIKVEKLKKAAHKAVLNKDVRIYPKWQEIKYQRWMEEMQDWPISRQVVWGIRIPVWYKIEDNENLQLSFLNKEGGVVAGNLNSLLKIYPYEDIEKGLQKLIAPKEAKYIISKDKPKGRFLQETDTFDTWFSSGQWPLVTLGYPNSLDFKYFYPTSVLETAWEILRLWVSRMIMFGIYLTGKPPFKDVYLHGVVRALDGRKMSKSLGNVINPEEYQDEFGTDALRMGLVIGNCNGRDFNFPRDKVIAARNFANKIWNMARYLILAFENYGHAVPFYPDEIEPKLTKEDKKVLQELTQTIKSVNTSLEKYRFSDASNKIYDFVWHNLADIYIEQTKNRPDKEISLSIFRHVYLTCLKLIHPFMPFVTETIWQELKDLRKKPKELLIESSWPQV